MRKLEIASIVLAAACAITKPVVEQKKEICPQGSRLVLHNLPGEGETVGCLRNDVGSVEALIAHCRREFKVEPFENCVTVRPVFGDWECVLPVSLSAAE